MYLTDEWVLSSIEKKFPKCMKVQQGMTHSCFHAGSFKWDIFKVKTVADSW